MQAGRDRTAGMAGGEAPERLADPDGLTGDDPRAHRFIRRLQAVRVQHGHDAATGQHGSEADDTRPGGQHGLPRRTGEVNATVPRPPRRRRRLEPAGDVRSAIEGPSPVREPLRRLLSTRMWVRRRRRGGRRGTEPERAQHCDCGSQSPHPRPRGPGGRADDSCHRQIVACHQVSAVSQKPGCGHRSGLWMPT